MPWRDSDPIWCHISHFTKVQKLMQHTYSQTHTHTHTSSTREKRLTSNPVDPFTIFSTLSLYIMPAKLLTTWVKDQNYWLSSLVVMNGERSVSCQGTNTQREKLRRRERIWCPQQRGVCGKSMYRYRFSHPFEIIHITIFMFESSWKLILWYPSHCKFT